MVLKAIAVVFVMLLTISTPSFSQEHSDYRFEIWNGDTGLVSFPDIYIRSKEYLFRFFPVGQFVFHNNTRNQLFISTRGAGFSFTEGRLTLVSYFYDTQISGLNGQTGDSTLRGLNYVRFKGSGEDQFSAGPADNVDFDGASGYINYSFQGGFLRAGKFHFSSGPSDNNNLIFNHTTGDFPLIYFQLNRSIFRYEFLYGFMKHFRSRNNLSDKSIIWHQASVNWPEWLRLYMYEAIIRNGHSVSAEYLNPLLFLRSADHYNFSPDNATLGAGFEISFSKFRVFQEILIDDLETGRLGSGWFRNKASGLTGMKWKTFNDKGHFELGLENVWVLPFTYSHRNSGVNMTHYGTQLGPELGPNSLKTSINFKHISKERFVSTEINVEFWKAGVTETGKPNVGDNVHIGHPEPPGNPDFSDYVGLLDGKKEETILISATSAFQYRGIRYWIKPSYFFSDYQSPSITIAKGLIFETGIRYELPDFDRVKPEFW